MFIAFVTCIKNSEQTHTRAQALSRACDKKKKRNTVRFSRNDFGFPQADFEGRAGNGPLSRVGVVQRLCGERRAEGRRMRGTLPDPLAREHCSAREYTLIM